jgi:non-canonical (house-cleaning) NTP pyrophosphatase
MRISRIMQLLLISALFLGQAAAEDVTPGDIMEEMDEAITITGLAIEEGWVEIANPGMASQDFTFWTLNDEDNNTYSFSEGFVLNPGAIVKVHTGEGNDTQTDLYWSRDDVVWDDGEVATLKDANGEVVARYPEIS